VKIGIFELNILMFNVSCPGAGFKTGTASAGRTITGRRSFFISIIVIYRMIPTSALLGGYGSL